MQPLRFDLSLRVFHGDVDGVISLKLRGILHPQAERVKRSRTRSAQLDSPLGRRRGLIGVNGSPDVNGCAENPGSN